MPGMAVPDTPNECSRYPAEVFLIPRFPVPDTRRAANIGGVIHRLGASGGMQIGTVFPIPRRSAHKCLKSIDTRSGGPLLTGYQERPVRKPARGCARGAGVPSREKPPRSSLALGWDLHPAIH